MNTHSSSALSLVTRALARPALIAAWLGVGAVAVSPTGVARAAESRATSQKPDKKPDMKKVAAHLKAHVDYPATRQQILDACAKTDEFTEAEKAWTAAHLPEGTYASADDVLKVLK